MFSVLALTALAPTYLSSPINLEGRIVNGIPIDASKFPWMVSLRQEDDLGGWVRELHASYGITPEAAAAANLTASYNLSISDNFCGASLIDIDPPIILTAAHCVDEFTYNETEGAFKYTDPDTSYTFNTALFADVNRTYPNGEVDGDSFQTLSITNPSMIRIHPEWNVSAPIGEGNDIALIVFDDAQTVDMSPDILPMLPELQLYGNESCCTDAEALTAIGYGRNATDGEGTETLEETTLNFMTMTDCGQSTLSLGFDFSYMADESIICAIGDDTDICQGDSGGPLVRFDVDGVAEIVGVTSFTWNGCNSGVPSAFTSVAHFVDWIEDETYGATRSPTETTTSSTSSSTATSSSPSVLPTDCGVDCDGENTSDAKLFMFRKYATLMMLVGAVLAVN